MILLRNLALFFVLFLPAAFATGVIGGFFVGPIPPPRFGYQMAQFGLAVVPLLLPSVLAVPCIHFAQRRWLRDQPRRNAQASDGSTASPRNTAFQHMIELSGDAPGFEFSLGFDAR